MHPLMCDSDFEDVHDDEQYEREIRHRDMQSLRQNHHNVSFSTMLPPCLKATTPQVGFQQGREAGRHQAAQQGFEQGWRAGTGAGRKVGHLIGWLA